MPPQIKRVIKKGLDMVGLQRKQAGRDNSAADLSPEILATIARCQPFTMTSFERLAALCEAVEYIVANNIPGAFVECGVWRGGSSMAAALTFLRLGRTDVDFHLFDTYEGMSDPTERDVEAGSGASARVLLKNARRDQSVWAYAPLEDVQRNLHATDYPRDRIIFVKGKVEETIPEQAPETIALLRLDTDWYESTKHELINLFPRLSPGGILIIDDYGHWAGARQAVDEYIEDNRLRILLHRIDYTGRIGVKA